MGGRGRRSAKTAPTAVLERNSACDASCLQVPLPSGRRLGGASPCVPAYGCTESVQTGGRACPNAGRCLAGNVGPCRDGGAGRADSAIRHSGPALKGAAALGAGAAAVRNSGPHSVLQLGPAGLLRASSATRAKPALRVFCRAAPPPHKRSSSSSVPPLLQVGICPYVKQQRSLSQFARPPSPPSPSACLRLSSCFRPSTSPRKQAMPRAAASLRVLVQGRIAAAANGG